MLLKKVSKTSFFSDAYINLGVGTAFNKLETTDIEVTFFEDCLYKSELDL